MSTGRYAIFVAIVLTLGLGGCAASSASPRPHAADAGGASPTLALWQGQSITAPMLLPRLLEASGGQVLLEQVLDRGLETRLARRGMSVTQTQMEAEQRLLMQVMAASPDQAQRALALLRQQRGLGEERFRQLLWRNAALRALIDDPGQVTPAALAQAYELRYGPRYETRLIVTPTLGLAAELVRRAREGESFIDLAIAHSTDASKAQGGLLPPISLQDPSFPAAVRQMAGQMEIGEISDPVALDQGFAVLKLERKIDGANLPLDDVQEELTAAIGAQMQQMLMQRLAREIVLQSELIILDPALSRSFARAKAALLTE